MNVIYPKEFSKGNTKVHKDVGGYQPQLTSHVISSDLQIDELEPTPCERVLDMVAILYYKGQYGIAIEYVEVLKKHLKAEAKKFNVNV